MPENFVNDTSSFLDIPFSKLTRLVLPVILFILPAAMIILQYKPGTSFTSIVAFGEKYNASVLPELSRLQRYVYPDTGYDGQFYAQLAVDPGLGNPGLARALDNPTYRARRIFLPALSYLIGLGIPNLAVQVYAVINLVFFGLLLGTLIYFTKPKTLKDYLVIMAISWTSGVIVSIARALTDLPASALALLAAFLQGTGALPLFASAILCKETSVLSILSIAWPFPFGPKNIGNALLRILIVVIPFAGWVLYVNNRLGSGLAMGIQNFEIPFWALAKHLWETGIDLGASVNKITVFEFLAPISLLIQALYLVIKPRLNSPIWRMGIGFAVLLFFLGGSVWVQQLNFTRSVLPLTIAFNLLLAHPDEKHFGLWFISGNLGLAWALVTIL